MFLPFFDNLRNAGVPVSLREFLAFLEGMKKGLATYDIDAFYYLGRAIMVKDERHLDRFDRAFAATFSGLEAIPPQAVMDAVDIPDEWLKKLAEKHLVCRRKGRDRSLRWLSISLWKRSRNALRNKRGDTKAATNGSARLAHRPLAPMATIPKASASANPKAATNGP